MTDHSTPAGWGRRQQVQGELPPPAPRRRRRKGTIVKLHNPFGKRDERPVALVLSKADTPPTQVRYLEARTRDGRYAASRSNDTTIVRIRPRRNPTSAVLAVQHGARSMPGPVHKAIGPRLIDAAYRTQVGAKRFGEGFMDTHRSTKAGQLAAATRAAGSGSVMQQAGFGARVAAPLALAQEAGSISGRRRGRKDAAKTLTPMAKSYRGDVFGKTCDAVQHGRWAKANSSLPDGARRGRRLPLS